MPALIKQIRYFNLYPDINSDRVKFQDAAFACTFKFHKHFNVNTEKRRVAFKKSRW